jgi:hypothetical protein
MTRTAETRDNTRFGKTLATLVLGLWLATYPMVSQFWTYKADEFLRLPAYGRDYPPAKP